jgi:hypothetical protein
MSASISDFADAGIIYAIEDNTGPDGYADVHDVGIALGQDGLRSLGVRLAWMRRYGLVEPHRRESGRWRVARKGARALTDTRPALDTIEGAKGVEMILLRRTVQHYARATNGRRNGRKKR